MQRKARSSAAAVAVVAAIAVAVAAEVSAPAKPAAAGAVVNNRKGRARLVELTARYQVLQQESEAIQRALSGAKNKLTGDQWNAVKRLGGSRGTVDCYRNRIDMQLVLRGGWLHAQMTNKGTTTLYNVHPRPELRSGTGSRLPAVKSSPVAMLAPKQSARFRWPAQGAVAAIPGWSARDGKDAASPELRCLPRYYLVLYSAEKHYAKTCGEPPPGGYTPKTSATGKNRDF